MAVNPRNFSYGRMRDVYPSEDINFTVPVFTSAPGNVGYQQYYNPTNPTSSISPTITGLGNNILESQNFLMTNNMFSVSSNPQGSNTLKGPYEECINYKYDRKKKKSTKNTSQQAYKCCIDKCGAVGDKFPQATKMCEQDCADGMRRWA